MRKTSKRDWLNDLLADTGEILVSGHPSVPERLGLPADVVVTFRFIGNSRGPLLALMTLEVERGKWSRIFSLLGEADSRVSITLNRLREYFRLDMPCVLYSTVSDGFGFYLDEPELLDDEGLRKRFGAVRPELVRHPGAVVKSINKSINDRFQVWGRRFLSRYMVVNDFDAFLFSAEGPKVIFELKRVGEDVETWRPYLDDRTNYAALMALCANASIRLRVIAYQAQRTDMVAVHLIAQVSGGEIVGIMILCPPRYIARVPLGERYSSSRIRESS